MIDYLNAAGPLAWPIVGLCLVALFAAARYALEPSGRQAWLALGATAAAMIAAVLGTVVGFQKSVAGLGQAAAEKSWLVLFGLEESLNSVVLALVAAGLVTVILTVGAWRRPDRAMAG